MTMTKWVVVIQCEQALRRCSGFFCRNDFDGRQGFYDGNDWDGQSPRFLAFGCGGCSGRTALVKLTQFKHRSAVSPDDVEVRFASCAVTDNHHGGRCPFLADLIAGVHKLGFRRVALGTHRSKTATGLRQVGIYETYEDMTL